MRSRLRSSADPPRPQLGSPSRYAHFLGLPYLFALVACGDSPNRAPNSTDLVHFTDSAGVSIAAFSESPWDSPAPWTIDRSSVVAVGDSDGVPGADLYRVLAVRLLDGGATAVLNAGTQEVLVYDSTGRLARRVGGRGDGPGELTGVRDLYSCDDGSLVVNAGARISWFGRDGAFLRSVDMRSAPVGPLRVSGVAGDCEALSAAVPGVVDPPRPGEVLTETHLQVWFSPNSGRADTIHSFQVQERVGIMDGAWPSSTLPPWHNIATTFVRGAHAYVGFSAHAEFRLFELGGAPSAILRWPDDSRALSREDLSEYMTLRQTLLRMRPELEPFLLPLAELGQSPTRRPAFLSALVDDEGRLWVQRYPDWVSGIPGYASEALDLGETDLRETWGLLDPVGPATGYLEMPPRFELHDIRDGYVVGVVRDSLGVERVHRYSLR